MNLLERKLELESQIKELLMKVRPLKKELEQVTNALYTEYCLRARTRPVWEARVNPAKTLQEARFSKPKITICSGVTYEDMLAIATQYFADNGIEGWTSHEQRDIGQFAYKDAYNGGPVLGVFEIIENHESVIRAFDFEAHLDID